MAWHKKKSAQLNPAETTTAGPVQVTLEQLRSPQLIRPCPFPKANKITDLLAEWCWQNGRPLNIISDSGLKDLLHYLEPGYEFPSTRHIAKLIKIAYSEAVDRLVTKLACTSSMSLTCDGWTSRAVDSYTTITAHFIDENWALTSCTVKCTEFKRSKAGERLAEVMHEAMTRLKVLDEKVSTIVHDQAASEEKAGKIMEENHGWASFVCTAHRLQNVIKHSLTKSTGSLSNLVAACRRVVGHFNHRSVKKQALIKKQASDRPLTLVQDCTTRWNSVFYMIKRLVKLRDPVTSVLNSNKNARHLQLLPKQWDMAEDIVEVLDSLEKITTQLSGELYPTLSSAIPLLYSVYTTLQPKPEHRGAVRKMNMKLRRELEKGFGFPKPDPASLPIIASALDPHFRKLKFLIKSARAVVHDQLIAAASVGTLCRRPAKLECSPSSPPCGEEESTLSAVDPPAKRPCVDPLLQTLLDASCCVGSDSDSDGEGDEDEGVHEEVACFARGKNADFSCDPLEWWKIQASPFPRLAIVAKEVLSTPATSAPSERVFSLPGLIVDKRRCNLKPDVVDALVFLHRNAKVLNLLAENPVQILSIWPLFSPPEDVNGDADERELPKLYDTPVTADSSIEDS